MVIRRTPEEVGIFLGDISLKNGTLASAALRPISGRPVVGFEFETLRPLGFAGCRIRARGSIQVQHVSQTFVNHDGFLKQQYPKL
jgi:hypothetical protein